MRQRLGRSADHAEDLMDVVNVAAKFAKFTEHWSPKIVAQVNDLHIKVVKLKGDFVWHKHADTDELFLVHKGVLKIGLREAGREREVRVGAGEIFVVPKGVEHITAADEECEMLLIEPAGTPNTGDAGGPRTATNVSWI
jgi:mannose-6-phosphate isomerase-like protein (cupin superfamily)